MHLSVEGTLVISLPSNRIWLKLILQMILPPTDSVVDVSREYGGLEGLQIQLSKAIITNCHIGESGNRSRSNLQPVIKSLAPRFVLWDGTAPVDFTAPHGTAYVTELLQKHADGDDKSVGVAAETTAVCDEKGKPSSLLTDGLTATRFLALVFELFSCAPCGSIPKIILVFIMSFLFLCFLT